MATKRTKRDIYKAIINGDHYSNAEAKEMRDHFKLVADACHELGDRFFFSFKEANSEYWRLVEICKARGLKD